MSDTNYMVEDEKDGEFTHVAKKEHSKTSSRNSNRRFDDSNYNAVSTSVSKPLLRRLSRPGLHRPADGPQRIYESVVVGDVKAVSRFMEKFSHRINIANADGYRLVHLAVMHNQLEVLKELCKLKSLDLNAPDMEGRTPLHHAVMAELPEIVEFLKKQFPHVSSLDNRGMMPIHLAAENGNVDVMKLLIPCYRNLSVKGESGFTAMHIAAVNNQADIITLLMRNGASPFIVCQSGNYPIHLAAKNAATDAIKAIVEEYLDIHEGESSQQLMSLRDREGNLTIHAAVNSGDIEEEGLTALHFAATQGSLGMLKAMAEYEQEFSMALEVQDVLCRTPLHWATLFDHVEVIKFLMKKGADLNGIDLEDNTPLLTAASKGSWKSFAALLSGDADPSIRNKDNKNCIHLLVMSKVVQPNMGIILKVIMTSELSVFLRTWHIQYPLEKRITEILQLLQHAIKLKGKIPSTRGSIQQATGDILPKLLNDRDHFGFTPLHYAAKYGHLTALNELISLGCVLNVKSNKKQTAFHLATQFGRYHTCVTMLTASTGATLKNEPDGTGMAALHLAVLGGHAKIVSLLLQRGTAITKDNNANTPLHLAAYKGQVECMQILLETHLNLLDMTNHDGNTALHLAAVNGHANAVTLLLSEGASILRNNSERCFYDEVISCRHHDVAHAIVMHVRWEEICQYLSAVYGTFMVGLVKNLPHICQIVLDRCVISSHDDPSSEEYFIEYNFTFLNLPSNFWGFAEIHELIKEPLLPLQEMVNHNRVECLSHPLCVNFLRMKWRLYGIHLNFLEMALYLLYLYALTDFVWRHDSLYHYDGPDWSGRPPNVTNSYKPQDASVTFVQNILDSIFDFPEEAHFNHVSTHRERIMLMFIIVFSVIGIIKELFVVFVVGLRYLSAYRLMEWVVYISSLIFVIPFLGDISVHVQWQFGVVCVFSSWFNCLVQLHRFDLFGIYVVMFLEIMKTLVQVVLIFSVLNIAFGLAFYVLMAHEQNHGFRSPLLSVYRTLILLTEIDYMKNFNEPYHDDSVLTLHFREESLLLLGIFILLMPILLMNLLIGLAVGDIKAVQRDARLKRLATQVQFHSRAEHMFSYLRKYTEERVVLYPNLLRSQYKTFYYKMLGMMEMMPKDMPSEEESFIARQLNQHETKLNDVYNKVEKNNSSMNRIMKRLHMSLEEEIWDEGSVIIEGIGETEEVRIIPFTQRLKAGMSRFTKRMLM